MSDRIKVLVADESRAVRLLVSSLLHDDGRFEVVAETASGADTVAHCAEADLVLTDLVLQDIDAFSVIEDVRSIAPRLPVVILAAVDPPYLRNEAQARGAAAFFTHDTDPVQLLDGLAAAVDEARVQ